MEAFEGEYFCPVDQQADDPVERVYRMKQLSENIEAIVLATKETYAIARHIFIQCSLIKQAIQLVLMVKGSRSFG